MLASDAGDWMLDRAPRGASPMDYPEMVEQMTEVARVLEAFEAAVGGAHAALTSSAPE